METHRVCNTYNETLSIENFGQYQVEGRPKKSRRRKYNLCRRLESKKRYEENPEVKEKMIRNSKEYHIKKSYGLSYEEYEEMFQIHENKCAICGTEPERKLHVDHCHSSGNIRGLLCAECNLGLGLFKDNKNFLQSAIQYLEIHNE